MLHVVDEIERYLMIITSEITVVEAQSYTCLFKIFIAFIIAFFDEMACITTKV